MALQPSSRTPWVAGSKANSAYLLDLTWLKLSNVLVQGTTLFEQLHGGKLSLNQKESL